MNKNYKYIHQQELLEEGLQKQYSLLIFSHFKTNEHC